MYQTHLTKKNLSNLLFILILIIFFILIKNLDFPKDVELSDETSYLELGVRLGAEPVNKDGLIYSFYYFFLSKIFSNKVQLYYVNFYLTFSLLLFFLYKLNSKNRGFSEFVFSFSLVCMFLFSRLFLTVWPFITIFSAALIAFYFFIKKYVTENIWNYLLVPFCFILCFVRPEFLLSFYASLFITTFRFFFRLYQQKKTNYLVLVGNLFFLIFMILNNPSSSSRSVIAFIQHYALREVEVKNLNLNPWVEGGWIVQRDFGTTESLLKMFLASPSKLIDHIFFNIQKLVTVLENHYLDTILQNIFFLSLLCILIFFCKSKNMKQFSKANLTAIILLLPSIFGIFVIYPRTHYLLQAIVPIYFLVTELYKGQLRKFPLGVSLFFAFLTFLRIFELNASFSKDSRMNTCNLSVIEHLNKDSHLTQIFLLSPKGSLCVYLNTPCTYIPHYLKTESFPNFVQSKQINLIIVNNELKRLGTFQDKDSQEFFLNPQKYNFTRDSNWNCNDESIYYKN